MSSSRDCPGDGLSNTNPVIVTATEKSPKMVAPIHTPILTHRKGRNSRQYWMKRLDLMRPKAGVVMIVAMQSCYFVIQQGTLRTSIPPPPTQSLLLSRALSRWMSHTCLPAAPLIHPLDGQLSWEEESSKTTHR